jgi:cysteinyl-tRNA synthetase
MRLRVGNDILPMVGHVRLYVCGITPYDVTHLGHAATYVWADAAERVLRWHGHAVTVARNVTDVDEVLFAEARRRGESHTMLATLQRAAFEATMATLQVRPPDLAPSAAQHIGHVIQLAQALLDRDAAY